MSTKMLHPAVRLAPWCGLVLGTVSGYAAAFGFGDPEIHSGLGQPLDVRVPINLAGNEYPDQLSLRLMPAAAYAAYGLESPSGALDGARVQTLLENGRLVAEISTPRSVTEPLMVLLLEGQIGNGRIVRQVNLLLDPPGLITRAAATSPIPPPMRARATIPPPSVAAPVILAAPSVRTNRAATPPPAPPSANLAPPVPPAMALALQVATPKPMTRRAAVQGTYGPVVTGDNLWDIAKKVRPERRLSMRRVMTSILVANPTAFNERHEPQLGEVLTIPSAAEMVAVAPTTIRDMLGSPAAQVASTTPSKAEVTVSRPAAEAPPAPGTMVPTIEQQPAAPVAERTEPNRTAPDAVTDSAGSPPEADLTGQMSTHLDRTEARVSPSSADQLAPLAATTAANAAQKVQVQLAMDSGIATLGDSASDHPAAGNPGRAPLPSDAAAPDRVAPAEAQSRAPSVAPGVGIGAGSSTGYWWLVLASLAAAFGAAMPRREPKPQTAGADALDKPGRAEPEPVKVSAVKVAANDGLLAANEALRSATPDVDLYKRLVKLLSTYDDPFAKRKLMVAETYLEHGDLRLAEALMTEVEATAVQREAS